MAEARSSVMKYLTPLFDRGGIFHSQDNSKLSKAAVVMMSPPFARATQVSTPLVISHPCAGGPDFLKLRQPLSVLPSKSSFQPSFFSVSVSWLSSAANEICASEIAQTNAHVKRPSEEIFISLLFHQ